MNDLWHTASFGELALEQLYAVLRLRQEIFVVEQDCVYPDLDGLDLQAVHIFCTQGPLPVAYQRCLPPGLRYPDSSLGRIVVHPDRRGTGLGRQLVQQGIDHNLARWPGNDIVISAQAHLQSFYNSMGFNAEGREYSEDGIPHRQMRYTALRIPAET